MEKQITDILKNLNINNIEELIKNSNVEKMINNLKNEKIDVSENLLEKNKDVLKKLFGSEITNFLTPCIHLILQNFKQILFSEKTMTEKLKMFQDLVKTKFDKDIQDGKMNQEDLKKLMVPFSEIFEKIAKDPMNFINTLSGKTQEKITITDKRTLRLERLRKKLRDKQVKN